MVVSLRSFASISPRPLKRETSILPLPPMPFFEQCASRSASSSAIDPVCALGQPEQRRAGEVQMPGIDHRAHLGKEERHQQRRDMRAVNIRIGHDDDLVVAQIVDVEPAAEANAKRLTSQIGNLGWLLPSFRHWPLPSTFRILPRSGSSAWVLRSRAMLGRAAGAESPSTMNSSVPSRTVGRTIGQLAGQAQFLGGGSCGRFPFPDGGAGVPRRAARGNRGSRRRIWYRMPASCRNGRAPRFRPAAAASVVASRSLVWPTNSGSRMKQLTSAQPPEFRYRRG